MTEHDKLERLRALLRDCGKLAVAFSGGLDSCFLLHTARETLNGGVLALTVDSVFVPRRELAEAEAFCRAEGVRQRVLQLDVLSLPGVAENPKDRCYACKSSLFTALRDAAAEAGFPLLADGTNADDRSDYRPGLRALREIGVRSPLLEAGLGKAEIRSLAREAGLSCWDKPSAACLASRVAYGETLTEAKLRTVEQAEELLRGLGIRQCRVRLHGPIARIEAPPEAFPTLISGENRRMIMESLKKAGFSYITLDLQGFRSGSMNEVL